jgi:hypothetical protein
MGLKCAPRFWEDSFPELHTPNQGYMFRPDRSRPYPVT